MSRCYHSASAAGASLGAERKCSSLGSTAFRITATTNATAMQFEGEDLLEQGRELREDVAHLGEADADGQRERRNRDIALREARFGNHLEAGKNDIAEHHDGAAAEHRLRQRG